MRMDQLRGPLRWTMDQTAAPEVILRTSLDLEARWLLEYRARFTKPSKEDMCVRPADLTVTLHLVTTNCSAAGLSSFIRGYHAHTTSWYSKPIKRCFSVELRW